MKYISIIGLLACLFTANVANCQTLHGREYQSLNGRWRSLEESGRDGAALGWPKSAPSEAKDVAFPMRPSIIAAGTTWFWRDASLPTSWTKLNVRLRLSGVSGKIDAWVNGRPVTVESRSNGAITFEITKHLMPNVANVFAVRISPPVESKPIVSSPVFGTSSEVELIASDEAHIESLDAELTPDGWIVLHIRLLNTSDKTGDAQLQAEIVDAAQPKKRVATSSINVVVSPGSNRADISIKPKRSKDSETREMRYKATVTFRQNKDILDNETITFTVPTTSK